MTVTIKTPKEFNFEHCYRFLNRSDKECLHTIEDGKVYKLWSYNGVLLLIEIENKGDVLRVKCLNKKATKSEKKAIEAYVIEWWGLEDDLKPFYRFSNKDSMLKKITKNQRGLRLIGFPELFETLIWAIIGQQINLNFAYTIKQRFVEKYGTRLEFNEQNYYLFPDPKTVSQLSIEDLKSLQFSRQKSNYTLNVANAILNEDLSKKRLQEMGYEAAKNELKKIKGIGDWTADYALMKCVRYPNAIPLGDAGLHNALKTELNLDGKPSKEMLIELGEQWGKYCGYICFYLWYSLMKE